MGFKNWDYEDLQQNNSHSTNIGSISVNEFDLNYLNYFAEKEGMDEFEIEAMISMQRKHTTVKPSFDWTSENQNKEKMELSAELNHSNAWDLEVNEEEKNVIETKLGKQN